MQWMMMVVSGLVALGILVFVHELGHFMVAKWAGIRVLKFSLGFGRKLVGFSHGGTEYLISMLPLGGYVKMAGENPREAQSVSIEPGDYFSRPWWVRLLVLLAGPAMNLIAAVVILGLLFWIGFQVPQALPQVVQVETGSPAAAAGLEPGDVVKALDGQPLNQWEQFSEQLNLAEKNQPGRPVELGLERRGQDETRTVVPVQDESGVWRLGVGIAPAGTNWIDRVFVGTPAEIAGFKKNDRITAVEGQPVWTKYDFQQLVRNRAGIATRITVLREGAAMELRVTPIAQQMPGQGNVGVIGVNFKASDREQKIQHAFPQAFSLGFTQTMGISKMIVVSLWQMITGQISASASVGGPITIMRMAGQEARAGLKDFFFFLAGISVMLAIVNLLPIPVLDGGTAVFFIIEGIIRKPISIRIQDISQQVGFFLLMALMIFATYNDLYKLISPILGGLR